MKITGDTVDILRDIDPDMEQFVVTENGKRVIYVQPIKALYGCVKSALLWYQLFSTMLVDMGFELNPYDLCVVSIYILTVNVLVHETASLRVDELHS